jgi:F-type H+-transporting ATPase subunit a
VLWKLPNIVVPPDAIFYIGPFPITNTLLISVVSAVIVLVFFRLALNKAKIIPTPLQNLAEWMCQLLLNLCEEVAGKVNGRRFFPWVASIFMLVLLNNWWEVIPGVESIGTINNKVPGCPEHVQTVLGIFLVNHDSSNCITPWIRPPSTDLNFTLALAFISVIATQIYGFKVLGIRLQLGRYFSPKEGPLVLVVGILELLLEPLRIISLSFRLFGNLFAGDVLLLVISFLLPFVGAIPFYFLEVFIGFIQAFVFAFLTLIFMTLGTTSHGHEEPEEEHAAQEAHARHEKVEAALSRGERAS